MKKTFLILAALGFYFQGHSQDIVVESALTALKTGNLEEAKTDIDRAIAYPGTHEKPKALHAKARIYMQIQLEKVPKYIESHPYREAAQALMRLAEVKPEYEKADVDMGLFNCAVMYYNDGVKAFNNKNAEEGRECMLSVVKIHDLNGGHRYDKYSEDRFPRKKIDTVSANANSSAAISFMLDTAYTKAIPVLEAVCANPITKTASNYNFLLECFSKTNKQTELFATLAAARKQFPDDKTIRNNEVYYYFKAGKQQELLKKLEVLAAAEPGNAELQFSLAIMYLNMANTKDSTNKIDKPATLAKAENAFTVAVTKVPDNPAYNYNFGVLYYDQGRDANEEMNGLADKINEKGNKNQKADQAKYDAAKKSRDELFAKAAIYMEKAATRYEIVIDSKKDTKEDTKEYTATYKTCLTALKDAYTILGKDDKYKEVKAKLDAMPQ